MLEQAFTEKSIYRCIKQSDINTDNYAKLDKIIENSLNRVKKSFDSSYETCQIKRNNKTVHIPKRLSDKLVIRKIANNIKGITRVKQQDRDLIIKNISTLISEHLPYSIIKLDIKSFYESVNTYKLLEYIKNDISISRRTKILLESILLHYKNNGFSGLPRGLSVSAILGEYVMKDFDKTIKEDDRFFFYSRFVDDIIIFSTVHYEKQELKNIFPLPFDLTYNKKKIDTYEIKKANNKEAKVINNVSFLGYKFIISNHKLNKEREISINISDKKIKKIKTRLSRVFASYYNNNDYLLLKKRIKLLTSNYRIYKKDNKKEIDVGIYFSNKHITNEINLVELDRFLKKLILSDGSSIVSSRNIQLDNN